MIRIYDRFKVTGVEKLDHGGTIKWIETGICLEEQDPLQIAMARNNHMLRCQKYKVEREHAFNIVIRAEQARRRNQTTKQGSSKGDVSFRNIQEKWLDPDFPW